MIGLGLLAAAGAALILWVTRKGRAPTGRVWVWLAIAMPLLPVAANSFGWIFTEMGRQPWVVFGVMTTAHAVSPGVGAGTRADLAGHLHPALRRARGGRGRTDPEVRPRRAPNRSPRTPAPSDTPDRPLAFAY